MPWRLIVDIIGFQSVWWASVLGAGAGRWEPGIIAAVIVSVGQLVASGERRVLLTTVLATVVLALFAESAMVASGLVRYATSWPAIGLVPVWIAGLWVVFATCMPATDRMLGENALIKAAVLGAIVGPPTYWAGEGLGALAFDEPRWLALAAIAAMWFVAMPLMLVAWRWSARWSQPPRMDADRSVS